MPYRIKRDDADTWILAASPIPTGLVMACFSERFTSKAWRFAALVPYSVWAGVLLMCGAVMLIALIGVRGPKREAVLFIGMALSGVWWFTLAGVFFYTAVVDPLANPIGIVAWSVIGSFYAVWCWHERRRLFR